VAAGYTVRRSEKNAEGIDSNRVVDLSLWNGVLQSSEYKGVGPKERQKPLRLSAKHRDWRSANTKEE